MYIKIFEITILGHFLDTHAIQMAQKYTWLQHWLVKYSLENSK